MRNKLTVWSVENAENNENVLVGDVLVGDVTDADSFCEISNQ